MRRFLQDKGRTSKPQLWEVTCVENTVQVMWGQVDGAMQQTVQEFEAVNVGKKNEKSPNEVAQEWMDRQILLRTRKGYVEVDVKTNKPLVEESTGSISFMRLPENLRFFKPLNSMNAHVQKLINKHDAMFLRKRDGMMHVISVDEHRYPRLYSSTMAICHKDEPDTPWMERYPHLEQELKRVGLPPNTILLGEMTTTVDGGGACDMGYAKDNFEYVGSVVKSLTPRALRQQSVHAPESYGPLGFCCWDIAFWDGAPWIQEVRAEERFNRIAELTAKRKHFTMPEILTYDSDDGFHVVSSEGPDQHFELEDDFEKDLVGFARDRGWEGYVVVDPDAAYGDRAFNFHGKAERPKFVAKLKPLLEADFVVIWDPDNGVGERGKGKKKKGVGSVMAHLYDPDTGDLVPICKVGGGLSDKDVIQFADPKLYPRVWQIEFSEWTPKGALRFPRFVRDREDKPLEECSIHQMPIELAEKVMSK